MVAAEGTAASGQEREMEAAFAVEVENLFGRGDFEGVPADPIDDVAPGGHAAFLVILTPGVEGAEEEEILEDRAPPHVEGTGPEDEEAQGGRQGIVHAFDLGPAAADLALIVVDGDEESAAGFDERGDVVESGPHGAGVVEDAPTVDDIELAEFGEVIFVEHGGFVDGPVGIIREVAALEFTGAVGRMRVEIEGVDGGAEAFGGEAEEAAAAACIEEALACEGGALQHGSDGLLGQGNAVVVEEF